MSRIEPLAGLIFGLELRLEEAKEGRQPLEVALFLEQHHLHCLLIFCATSIIYQSHQNLNFQVRLKEAETLGRRQESEVAIIGINSNIFSVINTINNIIINIMDTIIALYRHYKYQVATAEGLVGAWLGVTARLNFRFPSCHIWTIQPG